MVIDLCCAVHAGCKKEKEDCYRDKDCCEGTCYAGKCKPPCKKEKEHCYRDKDCCKGKVCYKHRCQKKPSTFSS
jgi:Dickkopf N-terminal cysteine-rich region